MTMGGIALEAHQAGGLLLDDRLQLPEAFLRFVLSEVPAVNPTKLIEAACAGSFAPRLGITEAAQVNVSQTIALQPVPQAAL